MEPLTERQIRAAVQNCSRSERQALNLPRLTEVRGDELEYLGWRDPKAPQRGCLVQSTGRGTRGIVVRAPETRVRRAAQCALCHSVHQDGIALFVAPRAGPAGRRGNTLGTYICQDLACSKHVRAALRPSRRLPDPAPVIAAQGAELSRRLDAFINSVLQG